MKNKTKIDDYISIRYCLGKAVLIISPLFIFVGILMGFYLCFINVFGIRERMLIMDTIFPIYISMLIIPVFIWGLSIFVSAYVTKKSKSFLTCIKKEIKEIDSSDVFEIVKFLILMSGFIGICMTYYDLFFNTTIY